MLPDMVWTSVGNPLQFYDITFNRICRRELQEGRHKYSHQVPRIIWYVIYQGKSSCREGTHRCLARWSCLNHIKERLILNLLVGYLKQNNFHVIYISLWVSAAWQWRYDPLNTVDPSTQFRLKASVLLASHNGISNSFCNTLSSIQNDSHFADDIFKCILLNENIKISI